MRKLFVIGIIIGLYSSLYSQDFRLTYLNHQVIPESLEQVKAIGGLSGLSYNPLTGRFLACADKFPARLISFMSSQEALFYSPETLLLNPPAIAKSELEGISFDPNGQGYYLSDEQSNGTRIIKVDASGQFQEVITPKNRPFLPLSAHNSGIEGLTLSKDGSLLYFAFERPNESCFDQSLTTIGKIDLRTGRIAIYPYPLHEVKDDILNTNGISEILWLDNDHLLVMERAYLPGKGNIVRLYETTLSEPSLTQTPINCTKKKLKPLEAKLVFDFGTLNDFKIDNAEGMTFNEDRSRLFIITDNNFNGTQETQLIALQVSRSASEGNLPK